MKLRLQFTFLITGLNYNKANINFDDDSNCVIGKTSAFKKQLVLMIGNILSAINFITHISNIVYSNKVQVIIIVHDKDCHLYGLLIKLHYITLTQCHTKT